jgi:hypothetical protein
MRLLGHEDTIYLHEIRGDRNLRLHLLRRAVKHCLPELSKQASIVGKARLRDRPYFAAEHFGGDVRIPAARSPGGYQPPHALALTLTLGARARRAARSCR